MRTNKQRDISSYYTKITMNHLRLMHAPKKGMCEYFCSSIKSC